MPGAQYSQQPSGDRGLVPQLLLCREPYSSFQLWPGERGALGWLPLLPVPSQVGGRGAGKSSGATENSPFF